MSKRLPGGRAVAGRAYVSVPEMGYHVLTSAHLKLAIF